MSVLGVHSIHYAVREAIYEVTTGVLKTMNPLANQLGIAITISCWRAREIQLPAGRKVPSRVVAHFCVAITIPRHLGRDSFAGPFPLVLLHFS